MEETRHIHIEDYDYPLSDERIAKYPLPERDQSKLLLYRHGEINQDVFSNLPQYLPTGTLLVFNNTRVIQARLHFHKTTGAQIEIFCLEPAAPHDYALMFQQTGNCSWYCMIGNLKKWKEGPLFRTLQINGYPVTLRAERTDTHGTSYCVRFSWTCTENSDIDITFAEILDAAGELPIPPYLNRRSEESDKTTYQTVYSKIKGSVAAPTAGLHFTQKVLDELDTHGVERDEITLHVGAGTFRPVKSEEISGHEMHTEYICVPRESIAKLIRHDGQCVAVGTTSVRTLESLYYIGLKLRDNPSLPENLLHIEQWEPYDITTDHTLNPVEALQHVLCYLDRNKLPALHASTQIIIAPGYQYHIVKAMITNFHQPKSTLLLLVSAFVGEDKWRSIYNYALEHEFRFLSYGDSSLLIP